MTPELFIASKASEAIKALYNADIEPSALQVSVTRKRIHRRLHARRLPAPAPVALHSGEHGQRHRRMAEARTYRKSLNITASKVSLTFCSPISSGTNFSERSLRTRTSVTCRRPARTSWSSSRRRTPTSLCTSATSGTTFFWVTRCQGF